MPLPAPDREISVVVPVFNSESTLAELVDRLEATMAHLASEFEVILVDDGSSDGSWQQLELLGMSRPFVHAMRLMRNFGQHNALLCGIRAAKFPVIITIDDDLQTPPEEIAKLLPLLDAGADVVYGVRERDHYGVARSLATRITKLVLKSAMGAEIAGKITSFRAFRTELRAGFADFHAPYVSIDVLLTWSTHHFSSVPTEHLERRSGESGYTFGKLAAHALNLVTGFSVLPLQLAGFVGFASTAFGLVVLAYVLGRFLFIQDAVPGFTFLASSIAVFSGAQLLAIGIIGEYLARMHFRSMERPAFVVRTEVGRPTVETGEDGE